MRAVVAFALAVIVGGPAAAVGETQALADQGRQAAGPATPDDHDSNRLATLVRLDVFVTDASGRPLINLKPADFELSVDGAPEPLESVVRIDGSSGGPPRAFGLFLDEYHTSADNAERVRGALMRFVDAHLGPQDRVIVMKPLDSLGALSVAKDPAEVREAIDSFVGRLADYEPRSPFERDFMARSPEVVEHLRRQVVVSGLNALAARLGGITEARKTILFVSEGLPDAHRLRGEEMLPSISSLVRSANRENVAIYGINPSSDPAGDDLVRSIAERTDGRSAHYDEQIDKALTRVAADSSAYYMIVSRPVVEADGRFHPVSVRVKRSGARVRTRSGFWAISPDEAIRLAHVNDSTTLETPFERTPRHASPFIRPWFGMSRAIDGRTRVTFVWEPAGRVPGDRSRTSLPVAIAMTAITPDGSTAFEGAVKPTGVAAETHGASAKAVFDVPPGRLLLRMSITGANSKQIDVDTRDLAVRDLTQPVVISTPAILRARTARQFRALTADMDAAPVASRDFSRAERLIIRFAAYTPEGDTPTVAARLVSRAGRLIRALDAAALDRLDPIHQIDLPLAGFAPGEYTIELTVSAQAGTAKELVNFRVTN